MDYQVIQALEVRLISEEASIVDPNRILSLARARTCPERGVNLARPGSSELQEVVRGSAREGQGYTRSVTQASPAEQMIWDLMFLTTLPARSAAPCVTAPSELSRIFYVVADAEECFRSYSRNTLPMITSQSLSSSTNAITWLRSGL